MSADDMRGMIAEWVASGDWQPLHDALLECGYTRCAQHMEGKCLVHRSLCYIATALSTRPMEQSDDVSEDAIRLQIWLSAQKPPPG